MWTEPADLRLQVQKLWDKGVLLAEVLHTQLGAQTGGPAPESPRFPRRLALQRPGSADLSERFEAVRAWATALRRSAVHYRIVERELQHRVVGRNAVPDEVWLDSLEAALALIGRARDAQRFAGLVQATHGQQPALLPWLQMRPVAALALAAEWPRLLQVVAWLQAHPRPGIYLRQVDLAGVDSKFIEAQRGVLAELLDLALPPEAVDRSATGVGQFGRRYGFQDKPLRIRFRLLDGGAQVAGDEPGDGFGQDIGITQAAFARLDPARHGVRQVFITENEVNFLAFPPVPQSMVMFGAGYGFEVLAGASWLHRLEVHYWGDIDTHGFAILDQLRAQLPQARSLLMDRATLLAHAAHWGAEPQPLLRDLPRLTAEESALFDELRDDRLQPRLRLEQERIGFGWVQQALARLNPEGP